MEIVRYRPGEALRWLQVGADRARQTAGEHGRESLKKASGKGVLDHVKQAASAAQAYGRSTYEEILHRKASAREYVLLEDRLDVVEGPKIESVEYSRIRTVRMDRDRATLVLDAGQVTIKPFAFLHSGRIEVPIGWERNGTEVPFELLIEEIAARAGRDVEGA